MKKVNRDCRTRWYKVKEIDYDDPRKPFEGSREFIAEISLDVRLFLIAAVFGLTTVGIRDQATPEEPEDDTTHFDDWVDVAEELLREDQALVVKPQK